MSKPVDQRSANRIVITSSIIISALFIVPTLVHAVAVGKLALPVSFDDSSYLLIALNRLAVLQDQGFAGLLDSILSRPPRSFTSEIIPLIGFMFFGVNQVAPYIANSIVAFFGIWALMHFLKADLQKSLLIIPIVLTWPFTSAFLLELRPDLLAGGCVAIGTAIICLLPLDMHHRAKFWWFASALFGAALWAKSSVSPVTVFVLGTALATRVVWTFFLSKRSLESVVREVILCLKVAGLTIVIAFPFYIISFENSIGYILRNTFGSDADIWRSPMPLMDQILYYFVGVGGQIMTGRHIWVFAIFVLVAGGLAVFRRLKINWIAASVFASGFAALWLALTLTQVKTQFIGVGITAFMMVTVVLLSKPIVDSLGELHTVWGRRGVLGIGIASVVGGLALFDWYDQHPLGGVANHQLERALAREVDEFYGDLLATITQPLSRQGTQYSSPSRTCVPLVGRASGLVDGINNTTLSNEAVFRGYDIAITGNPIARDLEAIIRSCRSPQYVLMLPDDPRFVRTNLPGYTVYDELLAYLSDSGAFALEAEVAIPASDFNLLVFKREDST